MRTLEEEVIISLTDLPECARCVAPVLLTAQFPHAWKNARDEEVNGIREVALCPACDRGQPTADDLLSLFPVDGQLAFSNGETFTELVSAWVAHVRQQQVDLASLDDELERWRRGVL